jgi:NAD(P)-dependent dehydrogenase (short-subunit alcohol dehydrogenase family)
VAQRFHRQVVVVTGASSGIGRAVAQTFAREGARVVLGARRKDDLEEAAASMRHGGREARAVACNVVVPQQVERLMEAATSRWDRLDVVVANAGVGLTGEIADISRDDFRYVLDVNVVGVFNTIQAALPRMVGQGSGTIVIVSSVLGYRGIPRFAAYCATKAAINALSEGLRTELEPKGVRVLLVAPGLTDTDFYKHRLGTKGSEPLRDKMKAMPAEEAAVAIVDAVHAGRKRLVLTPGGRLLASLSRHAPGLADRAIKRWNDNLVRDGDAGGGAGEPKPSLP